MEIEYLKKLNNLVRNFDIPSGINIKDKDICFIIALPRGGSTFLQQILISRANFAYISNLAAKFWKNPSLGIWLQNQLNIENYLSNFVSKFGTTFGPLEPHEFGWFWKEKLNINDHERIIDPVSWNDIYNNLNKIISISNTSLILDSPYVSSNFIKFSNNFKNAKFIILERDIWSVCNSICNARLLKYGNLHSFYGSKPSNFSTIKKIKNPVEQVVKQVY